MRTTVANRGLTTDASVALGAWALIANAPLQLALGLPLALLQASVPIPPWVLGLNAVSHVLLIIGMIGLGKSGAVGKGGPGRAGVATTILGLGILTLAEFVAIVELDAATPLYAIATLVFALGLIVVGIAVVRGRRWSGWARYAPLVCGLYVPLVMVPALFAPGFAANYAIGIWAVCWLFLGLALRVQETR